MSLVNRRKLISEHALKEGNTWVVGGFLRSTKTIGKKQFTIIADFSGQIQVLFDNPIPYKKESVIIVEGKLISRKNPNPNIPLGNWELIASSYEIISESSKPLPFELISIAEEALEPTRLKYRYLDLRKNNCQNLIKKSKIINALREYLINKSFIEVNTPSLSVSSKEGSNTFDTFLKLNGKDAKFSLSQSPQLYKQLLMMSGLEKYFQFATCFRLEDLRADRQYEFLQLDIEEAYSNQNKFFNTIEECLKNMLAKVFDIDINTPFSRITYKECLEKYGSDKPDLRRDIHIEKLSNLENLISENKCTECFGFYLPNCSVHVVEGKWLRSLITNNTIYIVSVDNGKVKRVNVMNEEMSEYEGSGLFKGIMINNNYEGEGVWIITTTCPKTKKNALFSLGNLIYHFSRVPRINTNKEFHFVWVTDWPLFEWSEEKNEWVVTHHLFTQPKSNSIEFDKENEISLGYDLVLNGVELASGSQRNHILEVQRHMFEISGMKNEDIEENFGWFLEAMNYGVPPHMGIAIGIDRLTQILLDTTTIRDVIAFPKNNSGFCPLTNSPTYIKN